MKQRIQLVGAMAVLASLSGIEVNAQSMSGDAASQGAVTAYPRFHTGNSGAGVSLGDRGDALGGRDDGRNDGGARDDQGMSLAGNAAFQSAAPLSWRLHPANHGANAGLGSHVFDPQNGGAGGLVSGNLAGGLVGDFTGDLSDDIIMPGGPFIVFVGDSPTNPVLLIDAGIVPTDGTRVLGVLPSLPGEGYGQARDMNTYFQSGEVIICLAGRDVMQSVEQVALVGPGSTGLLSGHGATLTMGSQSLTLCGELAGSDDRGAADDGDRGGRRDATDGSMGTSVSVGQQAAPQ